MEDEEKIYQKERLRLEELRKELYEWQKEIDLVALICHNKEEFDKIKELTKEKYKEIDKILR